MEITKNVKSPNHTFLRRSPPWILPDITTFIIATFCLIDNQLEGKHLLQRGPQPTLRDNEVLIIEVAGGALLEVLLTQAKISRVLNPEK